MTSRWAGPAAIAALSCTLLAACLFPFAWMIVSSLKLPAELYAVPPTWLPRQPTLDHYRQVLFASNVPRYFVNSLVISLGATALALGLAVFAAYGLTRFRFPGRRACLTFVLIGQLLPTAAFYVPPFVSLR